MSHEDKIPHDIHCKNPSHFSKSHAKMGTTHSVFHMKKRHMGIKHLIVYITSHYHIFQEFMQSGFMMHCLSHQTAT